MLRTFFRQRTISDSKMVITCDDIMSAILWMYISSAAEQYTQTHNTFQRPYELPAASHQHAGHLMCKGALHGLRCVYMGRVTSSGQTSLHSTPAAKAEPLLTYDTCAREDLRAHALWYLGLVVVFVVMVMALVRGGDGGQERWCTYVLYFH